MKSSLRILSLIVLFGAFAVSALALDGKALYKANCRVCHDKGSPNGTYSPMSFTQDQWTRFFKVKLAPSHQTAVHPTSGKSLLDTLSPKELKAIQDFCVDHAADSEQPATCG
jgi:cytochrome c5